MACVSEAIHLLPYNVFFVPARGGLGENVVFQANTIAASMAQQAGGYYTTMYVPDNVSETTYNTLLLEPSVINTLDKIKQANVILHSIGDALKMAHRRQSPERSLNNFNIIKLSERHLVIILIHKVKLSIRLKQLDFN